MNILIIGNGGREHALAWKIKQSPLCEKLFIAPGNAGTGSIGENIAIDVNDFKKLGEFSLDHDIELIVVGPEAPLVGGIRDYFEKDDQLKRIAMVGPGKTGAQLEGSKDFSKQFMLRNNIPTAKAKTFDQSNLTESLQYIEQCSVPIVLKADGLAAGKGVVICTSKEEAKATIQEMILDKKFGAASTKVLIEEFLDGIELSVFVLTDGNNYVILPEAKDYKRIGENDSGPNTGGMGAVSPVSFADNSFMTKVENQIIKPTINGLKKEGIDYKGFIFIGLMNVKGNPFVIEYNARMGDPETQAVMPRIKEDLVKLLLSTGKGELTNRKIEIEDQVAVTVVMVAGGYPGDYKKGVEILGLNSNSKAKIFHAGTKKADEKIVTNGGRVIAVTGMGNDLNVARDEAYKGVSALNWEEVYYRRDIGTDLLNLKN